VKKGEIRVRSMLKMQQDMEEEEGMDVDMTKQDINSDRSVVFVKNCLRHRRPGFLMAFSRNN
jgi:hypothetical protein